MINNNFQYPQYPQIQKNGIIWVQGIEGAKAYQLMPMSNAMLLDSENDGIFYIKTSDNVGMCSLRTFSYSEVTEQPKSQNLDMYVTREEFSKELNDLKELLNGKQTVQSTKHNKVISE